MKPLILLLIFFILLICANGQHYEKDKVIINIEDHDLFSEKGKKEVTNIEFRSKLEKIAENYGNYTIEKAFPYAPQTSYRSKKILIRFDKEIEYTKFKRHVNNELKSYKIKIDSIPILEILSCEELNSLPNDLTGQFSNEALMDLIQGKCAWNITTGNNNITSVRAITNRMLIT